jgi:hypothetical protein
VADRLVELFEQGATLTAAAAEIGVTRRTVQAWRARAWSREPRDLAYVELERRLLAARSARVAPAPPEPPESWEELVTRLEAVSPERWAL